MDLRPTVKTPPTVEPFSVAEVKSWAKIDSDIDDARVARLITAARLSGEETTGRSWFTQTLLFKRDLWPAGAELELPRPPVQSITSVKYYDVDGVERTLDAATYFARVGEDDVAVVLKPGQSWPVLEDGRPNAITVEYVAGFGNTVQLVPGFYLEGASLLIVHLYQNRAEEETGTNVVPLVFGLDDLWSFRRVVPL